MARIVGAPTITKRQYTSHCIFVRSYRHFDASIADFTPKKFGSILHDRRSQRRRQQCRELFVQPKRYAYT
ncbi:hypothetical protein Y032_0038g3537 [Ancylostoma ceylanicum]|uniref:Uncharacterized protein n=1 Tax=Ancylostoma ceylanicum TaxID=53326 RepID=A0A016UKB9_9BILA|nr:hypothetical protein Y032_0038g3537 [Ancylostoma ceylanicum]